MINKDLKLAVLGAGAMGCLFGGLLAEKGLNVILIDVWKEHVDAINKDGLKMDGHGGDRVIKVTFKPFSASSPPNRHPIAPAPKTATFKSLFIIVTFLKLFMYRNYIYYL